MNSIKDINLENKKVIIRVDYNVPMKNGIIIDDNRIKESLETIKYAKERNARIILLSHLGRVETEEDKTTYSLKPVADRLGELLNEKITFGYNTRGLELEEKIEALRPGQIILVENTRFEDLDSNRESNNDEELGRYWASLADIFINDAFGTAHRSHASNVGVSQHLPSAVGFLIEKELKYLNNVINNPEKPFVLILGGAKVSDKIKLIENIIDKVDYILIGGGMSYTFLKSKGQNIGLSLLDENSIDYCKKLLDKYSEKIILPLDHVLAEGLSEINVRISNIENINNNEMGLDIGPKTINKFSQILKTSNTVLWNGPLGYTELMSFENGTKEILKILDQSVKTVVIGGGDTASSAINYGYKDKFTHISTGGGASLELLEGKELPGIKALEN